MASVTTLAAAILWLAVAAIAAPAGAARAPGGDRPDMTDTPMPTATPTQVNPVPNNPLSLPAGTTPEACDAFVETSDRAFGLVGDGNFSAEDGFEVEVFADQLYVGMEADNALGARLWRTKPGVVIATEQGHWEEASSVGGVPAFGDSGNNDHVDSIQGFDGYIYVSTAMSTGNPSPDGTELWRSATGAADTWAQVNADGFGDNANVNFKDMAVVDVAGTDHLCGGTGNGATGTEIWCSSDGTAWAQQNADGFGQPVTAVDIIAGSSAVYGGRLYFGTTRWNFNTMTPVPGAVWRTLDTSGSPWTWEEVFAADTSQRVDIVGVYDGYIYAAFHGGGGTEIWRSATGDAGSWSQVNSDGFGDPDNGRAIVDGAAVYNGVLYFATLNTDTGAEIWRTADGTAWSQVGSDGLDGTGTNFAAELTPFNGHLYAWVSNYSLGQAVYRTKCGICETQTVSSAPATHTFAGIGAADPILDVTALTTGGDVTLCTYPNAFPNHHPTSKPVKRHYTVDPEPGVAGLEADLTLSYFASDASEYDPSDIATESTTYLTRWDEGSEAWDDCPGGDQSRDTSGNTATCAGVSAFSPWAVAGSGGAPTAVRLTALAAGSGSERLALRVLALGLAALAMAGARRRSSNRRP